MEFVFERRPAEGPLSRWVESVWFARGRISYARETIAPTGVTVAVLNLGDPIFHETTGERPTRLAATDGWVSGRHDRASLNEPTGETHCYGVISTPVGCATAFGLDPRTIRGRVVPLSAWKHGPALRSELLGFEPDVGLTRLLRRIEVSLQPEPKRAHRIERAVGWLEEDAATSVGEIARRLGVRHPWLDREFRRIVGLGPRRLAAILRVRRLLENVDVFTDLDWVRLAIDYGWYDQPHMIRDFKRYTGATPTAYVAAQRKHFEPSESRDASGFVPLGDKSVQDPGNRGSQAARGR